MVTRRPPHLRPPAPLAAIAAVATLAALYVPSSALACGGCFSPQPPGSIGTPQPGQVVLQNAERVIFTRDETTNTTRVWVEVRYSGAAEEFGWVLPLPKAPTVTVGPKLGLDVVDKLTAATYGTKYNGPNENCRNPEQGCKPKPPGYYDVATYADASSAASDAGGANGGGSVPQVQVVDSGQTGPYDYTVVKAKSADPLLTWLNQHGYATPKKALGVLKAHVAKGDVFVAIKLSNGQGVNAIRPIVLEMKDAEPCVPLRLTSIAAAPNMSVVVTLAGPGRAIPKNMLHVRLNPLRIDWFAKGANVPQVMAEAMDEAEGRAFVTESAQPGSSLPTWQLGTATLKADVFANAASLLDLGKALGTTASQVWLSAEGAKLFEDHAKITGPMQLANATQALAKLWTCGRVWSGLVPMAPANACPLTAEQAALIPVDGVTLAKALEAEIAAPLRALYKALTSAKMVTRLVLRISPDEMDRDPIFAFNPSLPAVKRHRRVPMNYVCTSGWLPVDARRLTIPGVGSWVRNIKETGIDPRFYDAPAALAIEVLDETGGPIAVAKSQTELVDTALLGAEVGTPSPAKKLALSQPKPWLPPSSDAIFTADKGWPRPYNCEPKPGWVQGKPAPSGQGGTSSGGTSSGGGASSSSSGGGSSSGGSSSGGGKPSYADAGTGLDAAATPAGSDGAAGKGGGGGCTAARVASWPLSGASGLWLLGALLCALLLRRRHA